MLMSKQYETTIGLEVHAALSTTTKIFCACGTKFGEAPNSQTCPVCLGMPGVLPVLNETVVKYAIRAALALNCRISLHNKFDRKNYYYPDLPKNYQISQDYLPIARDGWLDIFIDSEKRKIRINNIHMEEDAGKNLHAEDTGLLEASLVDFNRAGVPLLEIVTYPDMHSVGEVEKLMTALRNILIYTGVADCRMEEGGLRFEANISLRPFGQTDLGPRVEMKNLNSFKTVIKALNYEIRRQGESLQREEKITQETRLWDDKTERTYPMRSKEEAHDYRYFPEPDLVPLVIDEQLIEEIRSSVPELPASKLERFCKDYGLSEYDARVITSSRALADFYEEVTAICSEPKTVSNWVTGELQGILNEEKRDIGDCPISAEQFAGLLTLLREGAVSAPSAKDILRDMFHSGKSAKAIVEEKGLSQISDEKDIRPAVKHIINTNTGIVDDYCKGKEKAIGALIGKVMKETRGRAAPPKVGQILRELLEEEKRSR
jgi:aspartyl-tRNA(Asn)/glutamyl-tRNA(Gln) amidotransferase subunit B